MNREILCYHGTSLTCAEKIQLSKHYKLGSKRDDHWLGYGTYFFEEDPDQAELWGKNRYKDEMTATLETIVSADRKFILNLNTRQGIQKLREFIVACEKELEFIVGGETPTKPILANLLFSSLSQEEVWVIIRCFPVDSKFNRDEKIPILSFVHNGNHIDYSLHSPQVCVKNSKAIRSNSIKIVRRTHPKYPKGNKRPMVKRGRISYDLFDK